VTAVPASDHRSQVAAAITRAQADLEQAVIELDKLAAVDARSVALAAHALNNFLTVSGGVLEFLEEALRDYPDAQVKTWIDGLSHATSLMTHTVSQLMVNAAGTDPRLRLDDVDIGRLVERAGTYYRRIAELKRIGISVRTADDLPHVRGDAVLIAAVLDNLLSNAVKYSPPGKRIWVQVHSERHGVVCSVRDEGPGLSPEDQARLFRPGVRLAPVPSAGEPSTGYGLAVAKRFMDHMGGEIRCLSAEGHGATFSLWLPVAPGEAVA
jgi:signal transduction histidine kinase